jgi:hypothetical protein
VTITQQTDTLEALHWENAVIMVDSDNTSEKPIQDVSALDSRIDRGFRELVSESENCLKMNFLVGASACLRKALYELLEKEQSWVELPNGRIDYRESLIALKGKFPRVPPEYFDALSSIQQMSGDNVHEGSWHAWNPERLRTILELTKNVLHEMYVVPLEQKDRAAIASRMLGQLRADLNSSTREEPAERTEAKAAHDAPITQTAQQNEERQQERSRYVDNAVAALTSEVLPILEKAAAAFRKKDIDTKITKDFDVKTHTEKDPSVVFKCLGPRRVDGSRFDGPAVFFSSDGAVIKVEVAKDRYDHGPKEKLGSVARGQSEALVTRGAGRALSAYFDELENHG